MVILTRPAKEPDESEAVFFHHISHIAPEKGTGIHRFETRGNPAEGPEAVPLPQNNFWSSGRNIHPPRRFSGRSGRDVRILAAEPPLLFRKNPSHFPHELIDLRADCPGIHVFFDGEP